ncbi:MAG TPA: ATP-binding cassette domain-containing protein, partial [Acidimicrobiia bacterium]|nr:ATP-binding cassette domain-containing protein [Acidimicrobiia bacterium]
LAVPPRMRTLGFATSSLWFILGVPILPIVGTVGDAYGLRVGILIFVPVYVIGSLLLSSSGNFLNNDIEKVRVSTLARAEVRKARVEGRAKLLMVRSLDAGYDGVQVLFGINLDVEDGEMLALLGTNGAGKSTLLRVISGLLVPDAGAVLFDGRDITSSDPNRIAENGIMQVPGGRGIFPGLTVAESLRVSGWLYEDDQEYLKAATRQVLNYFPVLKSRMNVAAGSLSGGEQQMLSLAQAFIAKPRLLMIDELSLGLAPTVVESLLEIVKAIHDNGTTVILVEQSVNVALRLCDRAAFVEKGEVVFSGPTSELLGREDIVRSVFLAEAKGGKPRADGDVPAARSYETGERPVVLSARGLRKTFGGVVAVDDVDLDLYEGEILGLIGPNGAGKTTTFELISGHISGDAGRVTMLDQDVSNWSSNRRAGAGLGRSFQAARLWPGLTVQETLALAVTKRMKTPGVLPTMFCLPGVRSAERRVAKEVDEVLEWLNLGEFRDLLTSDLSTGTRRLVELSVIVAMRPSIVMLDEPSAGIAQAETEALAPVLRQTKEQLGCSMFLIEHDMGLMRALSDRVIAMDTGSVVVVGSPEEVLSHPRVVESYLGAAAGTL